MEAIKCPRGHYYDKALGSCPVCSAETGNKAPFGPGGRNPDAPVTEIPSFGSFDIPATMPADSAFDIPATAPAAGSFDIPATVPAAPDFDIPATAPASYFETPGNVPADKSFEIPRTMPSGAYFDVPDNVHAGPGRSVPSVAPVSQDFDIPKTMPAGAYFDNVTMAPTGTGTGTYAPTEFSFASKPGGSWEAEDYGQTMPAALYGREGFDPVVGWLICVKGPNRGRDYRLHSGTNFIGRSRSMDVCIENDQTISSRNHASVSFDDRSKSFYIQKGEVRNLIYVNGKPVRSDADLSAYDRIEIGNTELIFMPLCGDKFSWLDV